MKVKIENKGLFWTAKGITLFFIISYFIKFSVDSGENYVTKDSLLGMMIFHNVFVLSAYIIIIALMFAKSLNFSR